MIISAAIKDKNGTVYTGRRHHEIFRTMPREMIKGHTQGFVTDDGKFFTREEAAEIAFICGQTDKIFNPLTSEDLW